MNYIQFGLFFVFIGSVFIAGITIFTFLNKDRAPFLNRFTHLGEVFLIGSIAVIGLLFCLGFLSLYRAPFLWTVVLSSYLFLFDRNVRKAICAFFKAKPHVDIPFLLFAALVGTYIFRNCYFLMDVDSHGYYLLAQKLWLEKGSCFVGSIDMDLRILAPQFNAIPYALGLSIFPKETLFPQLINVFWITLVFILVFGYVSYRFNRYYALAAVMLIAFNDHIFYAGANIAVIINGAVIAFYFACVYNFWEAKQMDRQADRNFHFFLALLFCSQLLANKYQMFIILVGTVAVSTIIQTKPLKIIKDIFVTKRYLLGLGFASLFTLMWPIKNHIITGLATFPVMAGYFGVFNWTPEMSDIWTKAASTISPSLVLKYFSYMFVWHGVEALKYILLVIVFLPLILLAAMIHKDFDKAKAKELCFWVGLCIIGVIGISWLGFNGVRNYRYIIALATFAFIFSVDYIFVHCLKMRKRFVIALILILLTGVKYKIIFSQIGPFQRPTIEENIGVLLNRIHTDDVVGKFYWQYHAARDGFYKNYDKAMRSAWGSDSRWRRYSPFMVPTRPQILEYQTTVVNWDSYGDAKLIAKDIRDHGIDYVMVPLQDKLLFETPEEYAKRLLYFEKRPKKILYDYGHPEELLKIRY